jgi:superfamily II DNA or RNA helicase
VDTTEAAYQFSLVDPKFKRWTPNQEAAFQIWRGRTDGRLLLFYPTGKGKTKISLTMIAMAGFKKVCVIAPPKTHVGWERDAATLGLEILVMSHQKFRDKGTKLPREVPLIVDEFHMLGKHNGVGFKKLDRMAVKFPAIILCSATPNYNDADRCYNVAHVLEPGVHGDFLGWIMNMCETKTNPFASTPDVLGFKDYESAADYLSSQPYTAFLEDEAKWTPRTLAVSTPFDPTVFDELGYDARHHRIMASQMEASWARRKLVMLEDEEISLRPEVWEDLRAYIDEQSAQKFLLYSTDKVIAKAIHQTFMDQSAFVSVLITGDTAKANIERAKQIFVLFDGPAVLTGTSALATGVDDIDRACDHLIIVDDTNDDSLRRQIIGRVLPRGDYERDTIVTIVEAIQN